MTPSELDLAFTKVRDELKMTSREARQKAEDEIRAYVEMLEAKGDAVTGAMSRMRWNEEDRTVTLGLRDWNKIRGVRS